MKKKLLVLVAACSMMVAMSGCGGSDSKKETTAPTTEFSEPVKIDDSTEADRTDTPDFEASESNDLIEGEDENKDVNSDKASSADADVAGMESSNGVYYSVGDLKQYSKQLDTIVYANEDKTETLAIYANTTGTVSAKDMLSALDNQIKTTYGDKYEEGKFQAKDFEFKTVNYLNGNKLNSLADVKTYTYSDGKVTIYVEHCVEHGKEFPSTAEDLLNSIVIK